MITGFGEDATWWFLLQVAPLAGPGCMLGPYSERCNARGWSSPALGPASATSVRAYGPVRGASTTAMFRSTAAPGIQGTPTGSPLS